MAKSTSTDIIGFDIPSHLKMIDIGDLIAHPSNPRSASLDPQGIWKSYMRAGGFDPHYPILAHRNKDGTIILVKGHRRLAGILWGFENDKENYMKFFPAHKVPVDLVSGWSEDRILRTLHDHDDKSKPLTQWESIARVLPLIASKVRTIREVQQILGFNSTHSIQQAVRFDKFPGDVKQAFTDGKLKTSDILPIYMKGQKDAGGERDTFVYGTESQKYVNEKLTTGITPASDKLTPSKAMEYLKAVAGVFPPLQTILAPVLTGNKECADSSMQYTQTYAAKAREANLV